VTNRGQRAESRKQKAESREQRAESKEERAERRKKSREQRKTSQQTSIKGKLSRNFGLAAFAAFAAPYKDAYDQ
jgi:hypothetical protein